MMTPPITPVERSVESILGMSATLLGVITSLQEQIEHSLRVISLLIGISIGLISLYRLLKKPK